MQLLETPTLIVMSQPLRVHSASGAAAVNSVVPPPHRQREGFFSVLPYVVSLNAYKITKSTSLQCVESAAFYALVFVKKGFYLVQQWMKQLKIKELWLLY